MNNYQLNRYKMYGFVAGYLNNYKEKLDSIPGLKENLSVLLEKTDEITDAMYEQSRNVNKESFTKKELRKDLEKKMLDISHRMALYAALEQNFTLLENCRHTKWSLTRLTQLSLIARAGSLYNLAKENAALLVPYGITPDSLRIFQEAAKAYEGSMSEHRHSEVLSVMATKKIAAAFTIADEALQFIDLASKIMDEYESGFYSGYKSLRKQLRTGTVKMALKANAFDEKSGMPLANVRFTFTHTEAVKPKSRKKYQIVKKTRRLGGFKIMHMPKGSFDVVAAKPGYRDAKLQVFISGSELVRVRVEMGSAFDEAEVDKR